MVNLVEANDYTYRGYSIVFKKNGEVTVLDKDYRVVRSGLTDSEAREWIDAILPEEESLKEDKIADKIKSSQDRKEMTKRAIRILKAAGGDYEDLVQEYKDTYGEDPLEESLKESFEGTTIRDWIVDGMTRAAEDRLQKLADMSAPQVMIDRQSEMVDELKSGKIPITGDLEVLDLPLEDRIVKTGRGGKTYFSINGGKINYFPYAKYGPYIKMNESLKEPLKEFRHINRSDPDGDYYDLKSRYKNWKYFDSPDNPKFKELVNSLSEQGIDLATYPGAESGLYVIWNEKNSRLTDLYNEVSHSVTDGILRTVEKILDDIQIDDQIDTFDILRYGEVGNLKNQLVKEIQFAIKSKVNEKTSESLNESIEDEYLEDIIGDTFIEDGVEYEWTEGYGEILETNTGKWMVLGATTTETEEPETYFFVVDVEDGFIDWGPCDTLEEAVEFLESKESDEDEEEEYDDDDLSFTDDYDEEEDEE